MNPKVYQVPFSTQAMRFFLRPFFRLLFHLLSRVRIYGKNNIPKQGAYLIAINHISLFEPPFILAFWPTPPEAAGAAEIWEKSGQSFLAKTYGGIPVHRGEFDRKLIDTMLKVLRSGRPLVLAPEGGRSHSLGMRRALPGIAYLAETASVPVVPVGIVGTSDEFLHMTKDRGRPILEMRIGEPFYPPEISGSGAKRRAARQHNADLIMIKIAELLPPEYHGVYASGSEIEISFFDGQGDDGNKN